MRVLFWVVVVVGVGLVAVSRIVPEPAVEPGRFGSASMFLANAGVTLSVIAIGITLWFWPTAAAASRLRRLHPDGLVMVCQRTPDLSNGLRRLAGDAEVVDTAVPTYFVMVADASGLALWRGRPYDRPLARVSWKDVLDVRVGVVHLTRTLPSLELIVTAHGLPATLVAVPCRPGWELWPTFDPARTTQLAERLTMLSRAGS